MGAAGSHQVFPPGKAGWEPLWEAFAGASWLGREGLQGMPEWGQWGWQGRWEVSALVPSASGRAAAG